MWQIGAEDHFTEKNKFKRRNQMKAVTRSKLNILCMIIAIILVLTLASCGGETIETESESIRETESNETESNETEFNETESNETEPDETESTETEPTETESTETEPTETESAETEPAETESTETTEPAETESTETEPAETEPTETETETSGGLVSGGTSTDDSNFSELHRPPRSKDD